MVGHVFFWLSYPQAAARPFQWNGWSVAVGKQQLLHPIPSTHCNGGRFALQVGHLSGNGLGDMGWPPSPISSWCFSIAWQSKKISWQKMCWTPWLCNCRLGQGTPSLHPSIALSKPPQAVACWGAYKDLRVCVVIHPTAETCFHLNLKSKAVHNPRTTTCKQSVVLAQAVEGVRAKIKLPHY